MSSLRELKQKYFVVSNMFRNEPRQDCPRCHGTGEYLSGNGNMHYCFCLFMDNDIPTDLLTAAHDIFNDMARSLGDSHHDNHL